jgi:hypothetical protein
LGSVAALRCDERGVIGGFAAVVDLDLSFGLDLDLYFNDFFDHS